MKIKILLVSSLLTTIGIVGCQTGGPVDETSVGIGADGVFNDPSPSTFEYPTTKAVKVTEWQSLTTRHHRWFHIRWQNICPLPWRQMNAWSVMTSRN